MKDLGAGRGSRLSRWLQAWRCWRLAQGAGASAGVMRTRRERSRSRRRRRRCWRRPVAQDVEGPDDPDGDPEGQEDRRDLLQPGDGVCARDRGVRRRREGDRMVDPGRGWQGRSERVASAIRNAWSRAAPTGSSSRASNVSALVTDALRFAKQHHVPVAQQRVDHRQAGGSRSEPRRRGATRTRTRSRGVISAEWMIWNSSGKAQVVMFRTNDAGLNSRDAATVATLKQCAGCKILDQINAGFDITTTPKMSQQINSILDRFVEQGRVHPDALQRGRRLRRARRSRRATRPRCS